MLAKLSGIGLERFTLKVMKSWEMSIYNIKFEISSTVTIPLQTRAPIQISC